MGRDEIADVEIMLEQIFQSTRPVWGATDIKCARLMVLPISIHAPRVGRDHYCATAREYYAISIHAPRVGRDHGGSCTQRKVWISIHAPRVGRDVDKQVKEFEEQQFQSTRPVWGATRGGDVVAHPARISIHAPRVGRDEQEPVSTLDT